MLYGLMDLKLITAYIGRYHMGFTELAFDRGMQA